MGWAPYSHEYGGWEDGVRDAVRRMNAQSVAAGVEACNRYRRGDSNPRRSSDSERTDELKRIDDLEVAHP